MVLSTRSRLLSVASLAHRPVSTFFLFIAITFSVLSWSSTPLQAELIFLGFSTQNHDNPNGRKGPANVAAIVSVINGNLEYFSSSVPISSSDLMLVDKDDGFGGDSGFDMTGIGSNAGTYAYTGSGVVEIMTLKSARFVEVYAIPTDMQSGTWENRVKHDLSHASVWRIEGAAVVPEPTSFAMFGIALIGLSRRRRQR